MIASELSNTAKSVVTPMPVSATRGSAATGTVRERGIPLLSAQLIVTPATPASDSSAAMARASGGDVGSGHGLQNPPPRRSAPTTTLASVAIMRIDELPTPALLVERALLESTSTR